MIVTVAADDRGTVYADGMFLFNLTKVREAVSAQVRCDTKVIAIEVTNDHQQIGLIVMTSSGIVSDNSWKCTSSPPPISWKSSDCDDSSWPPANAYFKNDGTVSGLKLQRLSYMIMEKLPSNAYWLSTVDAFTSRMFCRRALW